MLRSPGGSGAGQIRDIRGSGAIHHGRSTPVPRWKPHKAPDITRGTLEGDIAAGKITLFRLQSTADTQLRAYIAEGEVLPVATHSFGSIGILAIHEMARFYRYELIEHNFPHHGAIAFAHIGNILHKIFRYLGITEIGYNRPSNEKYPTEIKFD